MYCNNFSSLTGCGNCSINLANVEGLNLLSSRSINHVVNEVFESIRKNTNYRLNMRQSIIVCNGCTSINFIEKDKCIYNNLFNRTAIATILKNWFNKSRDEIYDSYTNIYLVTILCSLNSERSNIKGSNAIIEIKKMMDEFIEYSDL